MSASEGRGRPGTGIRRYDSSSQLRNWRQFGTETVEGLRGARAVTGRLMVRDLRSRYRQSLLGYVWLLVPPLASTAVWIFLNNSNILNVGQTGIPYPVYVLVGTTLWQAFVDGLNSPIQQLSTSSNLLSKMNFPAESLLLAGLGTVVLNGVIRLLVVVPVLIYYSLAPGLAVLLVPFGLLSMILLGLGIGLVLAPFGALYRDIPQAILVVVSFWFLVTPVVWQAPPAGAGRLLVTLNPVAPLLNAARDWLTAGPAVPPPAWYVAMGITLVLVVVGWILVRLSLPHLVDRIGS
jgi:lipopolysaccharide transport system permease protein